MKKYIRICYIEADNDTLREIFVNGPLNWTVSIVGFSAMVIMHDMECPERIKSLPGITKFNEIVIKGKHLWL